MEFLLESILQWQKDAKKSVWMKVPIAQSYLIPVAFSHGFSYHHAVDDYAMLLKWLPKRVPNKVPPYATHQVGVSGTLLILSYTLKSLVFLSIMLDVEMPWETHP